MIAECKHPNIVPIDADWARCTACGDGTFPLSDFAAGLPIDPDATPKKKRKASTSPNARTLAECRKRGWTAQTVERPWNPHTKVTLDLFGVIDIVAIVPTAASDPTPSGLDGARAPAILGIQATSDSTGGNSYRRRAKILAEPRAKQWVEAGGRLELWSWSKRGAAGTRKLWQLRVEAFTVEDWRTA